MLCGHNIVANDLLQFPALSMLNCLDLCNDNHDCEAVVYQASQPNGLYNCWLKREGFEQDLSATSGWDVATRAPETSTSVSASTSVSSSATQTALSGSITPGTATTSSSSPSTSTSSASSGSLSTGAKAGIGAAVGVAAVVAAALGIWWWLTRRAKHRSQPADIPEVADTSQSPFAVPFLAEHDRHPRTELRSPTPTDKMMESTAANQDQSQHNSSQRWTGSTQLS
ncbi:hypothetical protein PMZ80_007491 [Knufia obscura]|nr:hypothetical protein PMZ80_007491 [Knufia obscura]